MNTQKKSKKNSSQTSTRGFCIVGNCWEKTTEFTKILSDLAKVESLNGDLSLRKVASEGEWLTELTQHKTPKAFKKAADENFFWLWQPDNKNSVFENWEQLKSHFNLIIVYTSPIETLNSASRKDGEMSFDLQERLNCWKHETEILVAHYQASSDKSAVVSIDTAAALKLSFRNLEEKWSLGFKKNPARGLNENATGIEQAINISAAENAIAHLHRKMYQIVAFDVPSPALNANNIILNNESPAFSTALPSQTRVEDDSQYSTLRNEALLLQEENRDLTLKLHQIQERYEKKLLEIERHVKKIDVQHVALHKVYSRYPAYWNIGSLTTQRVTDADSANAVDIDLVDAELNFGIIKTISIRVFLDSDVPSIGFKKTPDAWLDLMQKPSPELLMIAPRPGAPYFDSNSVISKLGTKDWLLINELIKKLGFYLGNTEHESYFPPKTFERTKQVINALAMTLDAWPTVPRYDKITLRDTLQEGDYKSLGLAVSNFSVGSTKWGEFFYRVATLDEPGSTFGTNPRLEFPIESKSALQNWFAESEYHNGQRLELRFAKPDAMDLQVWGTLAENDKLMISGLISSLEVQLDDLEQLNDPVKVEWDEWRVLSRSIRRIAAKKIASA